MNTLSPNKLKSTASGKTILIGEHAVVYGHTAVALSLPDLALTVTLIPRDETEEPPSSWQDSWQIILRGNIIQLEKKTQELLLRAFSKALELCGISGPLSNYQPQKIVIDSQIPLGGGMGGSAAMSICFLRLAQQIAHEKNLISTPFDFEKQLQCANEIDHLFHFGKASGLDVCAILANGIIKYKKGELPVPLKNGKEFWLVLVDSRERAETSFMVKKCADRLVNYPDDTKYLLSQIGKLADKSVLDLSAGNLVSLADNLNETQNYLCDLGVSTEKINEIVTILLAHGALAAKLTGAGGGGLVLGLFDKKPEHLYSYFDKDFTFVTHVP